MRIRKGISLKNVYCRYYISITYVLISYNTYMSYTVYLNPGQASDACDPYSLH